MAENKQSGANPIGKLLAWLRRLLQPGRTYEGLIQTVSTGPLQGMNRREFELLVGDAFRLQGDSVGVLDRAALAGGADLALRRGNRTLLVAYRQWNVSTVGPDAVRDLAAVVAAQGADGGLLLTLGRFSAQAQAAARDAGIELMDGARLVPLIQQAQETRMAETAPAPLEDRPPRR